MIKFLFYLQKILFLCSTFCKSKFYAITIKNLNKSRPTQFLKNKLYKYLENNREKN